MDTPPNPNPSPSLKPNTYHIGGIPVEFPYKPYGSQLAFMSRVISTLERAHREGHCHALLESPTGTGKTLSLLCSSLAWQKHQSQRHFSQAHSSVPALLDATDPLLHGGGFIVEPDTSGNPENTPQASKAKAQKKRTSPNIYYASRTHSQISQVIREYKRTAYRVPMAVLASRKHYCTNQNVRGQENLDGLCKMLLESSSGCSEFKNANKVKSHPSIQIGGCLEVHDIEDLVRIGQHVKGCSYFAAQTVAAEARLIFCPYSYIINPIVRRAMDVDLKGCILIIDEAHNIEDMAREGGSVDVEEDVLHELQAELGQLCMIGNLASTYKPLYDIVEGIVSWINVRKDNLQKKDFEHYLSHWTGEKAKQELQQCGISQQYFPILQECVIKAIKDASEAAQGEAHLTGISLITLEGLFSSLNYFFSRNGCFATDYQLALQRYVKRDASNAASGWTISLSLWCLNPAVVFKDIADLSHSVILTSGTLSPMSSFSSELGVRFDTCMEAPHVINMESQVWAAVIPSGADNIQLNASYKTSDSCAFQDSLGGTLVEICKNAPGGALIFFPSYKLLEKLQARWHQTGLWSKLNAQKEIFIEPRGSTNEFEHVLRCYYDAISRKNKSVSNKIRSHLKPNLKHSKGSAQNSKRGAAFLAVCRGKVSEGIDFSDDNARVVVIVGIPFPNKKDAQVMLKKNFNDTYKSSKNLLNGSEWYCHQAFRALNQAAGRCIRHKFDYGAVIFLDERYKEQRNLAYISKWLRGSIKSYNSFDESLKGLQTFFRDRKQRQILVDSSNVAIDYNCANGTFNPTCQLALSKGNHKLNKFNDCIENMNADKKPLVQISQFMKISTFQPQTSVIKVNEVEVEHLSKNSINVDSESNFLGLFSTQSVSPGSSSKVSTVVHDTKDNIYKPEGEEYLTVINNVHQASDVSCITSPDKLAFSATSDTKDCPHFDSVNSYNRKKRRLELHNTSYPKLDSSNSSFSESSFKLGFPLGISTPQINDLSTKHISQDINKVGIDLSTQYQYIPPLDVTEEMELRVCCLSCKNHLGLPENRFLIKSFMMQSSKIYLSYIWKYGTLHSPKPDYLSNTQRMNLHILIFDTTFINERILKEPTKKEFSHQGVWCEEDGCVFRTIFCPFCIADDTCLGVHVLAADASNVNLLNKVILYEDRLCVSNESKAFSEGVLPNCGNLLNEGSDQGENERHTYSTLLEKPGKPATIKENTDSPRSWSVDDARYVSKAESFRPDYSSRLKSNSAKEHADNHQRRHVDFEKFAYKSQEKHDSPQAFPLNSQCVQKQIANSKLRLPRQR